jgi:predicted enzyme related to lactoylglutathione lyase
MIKLSTAALAAAVALAETAGPAPFDSAQDVPSDSRGTPATLMTQDSVNVFRRFSVDRAKVLEFYGDVLGLPLSPTLNMPGGGQMSQFHVGTSLFKFTNAGAGRQDKSGPVLDVTGLRVFTYFYADEAGVAKTFTSHGYPAPDFRGAAGHRRAMVEDPDGQWVELVIDPRDPRGGDPSRFEVGATVSDMERSRAFYREFVGLEELPAVDSAFGRTLRFRLGSKSANILNLWKARPGAAANTYTAGIQYVISDAEAVDGRAKSANVKITQPLGPFGGGLRTIWLADPDGITNYFAQILRAGRAGGAG